MYTNIQWQVETIERIKIETRAKPSTSLNEQLLTSAFCNHPKVLEIRETNMRQYITKICSIHTKSMQDIYKSPHQKVFK